MAPLWLNSIAAGVSLALVVVFVPSLIAFVPMLPLLLSAFGLYNFARALFARNAADAEHRSELSLHLGLAGISIAGILAVIVLMAVVFGLRD